MDVDISRWILEFILRQPVEDRAVNSLLSVLPLSNDDPRLKKTINLRRIQSEILNGSVSETVLELLEIIDELDFREGIAVSESMKAAYCAVAVDCTVRFLEENVDKQGKYFNAVERIWRGKICEMESSEKAGLVSDQLINWKDEIEAAVWNEKVCKKVLKRNTRNDALKAVRVYVAEAWENMGPSFVELAAQTMNKTATEVEGSDNDRGHDQVGERAGSLPNAHQDVVVSNKSALGDKEMQKGNVLPKRKHVAGQGRRSRGVKITDNEEYGMETSCNKYDCLSTPKVNEVQEALKSSSLELQAVVRDPLPDALRMADAVLSGMATENMNHEPSVENQNIIHVDAPNPSVDKSAEAGQANEGNLGNQCCLHQNNVPGPSLMTRNSTARTYEWDDSIDTSPDGSPNRSNRLHLPSPKRRAVSPLKKYDITKFARRRKIKKWSALEEDTLRTGVQKYGKGNWKLILNCYRDIFEERTEVDLKDKWRNMMRY